MTTRPVCPREHRGWDHPLPLDTIPARYGGGWSCPGIRPDGADCGYQLTAAGAEQPAGALILTPDEAEVAWRALDAMGDASLPPADDAIIARVTAYFAAQLPPRAGDGR